MSRRSPTAVLLRGALWTMQAALGAMAGFAIADASIAARLTPLKPARGSTLTKIEVRIFGVALADHTGYLDPDDGAWHHYRARRLTPLTLPVGQGTWVYGTLAACAVAGLLLSLGIAILLVRRKASAPSSA